VLTALALGARALAGLAVPPSRIAEGKNMAFPSKMLPPALHRQYVTTEEQEQARGRQVRRLVQGITGAALQRSKEEAEEAVPEVVRERRLRLGSTRPQVTEVVDSSALPPRSLTRAGTTLQVSFADVAAEHFIMPLVNHMWLHLRDVETRTRGRSGTGTGIILGSVVLAQYLGTLAVLVHAARHAPAFLGVVVPGAIEIAAALGRRGVDDAVDGKGEFGGGVGVGEVDLMAREAAVFTAALEVALIALDASVELDGGRSLGLEHTALLLDVGEWAGGVLAAVEGGRRVSGGGGAVEGRVAGAAAGVVIRVETVVERWGRSMVGL
jgi:telomere length regulation protein